MSAVEGRRNIMDTVNDLIRRVGRLERTATGTLPQAIPLRDPTAAAKATAATSWTVLYAATFPRATRGIRMQVSARADAGTAGEVAVCDDTGAPLPAVGGAPQTVIPVTGATAAVLLSDTAAVPYGLVGDLVTVTLCARRVSGTGSVYVTPLVAAGVPA